MKIEFDQNGVTLKGLTPQSIGSMTIEEINAIKTSLLQDVALLQNQLNTLLNRIDNLMPSDVNLPSIFENENGEIGIGTIEPRDFLELNKSSLIVKPVTIDNTQVELKYSQLKINHSGLKFQKDDDGMSLSYEYYPSTDYGFFQLNSGVPDNLSSFDFALGYDSYCPSGVGLSIYKGDRTSQTPNINLQGNANSYLNLNTGNVGIGVNPPLEKLHVSANVRCSSLKLGVNVNHVGYVASIPTTGTYKRGDRLYNLSPSASGFIGWVCVTTGTPGTWKTFGSISA